VRWIKSAINQASG